MVQEDFIINYLIFHLLLMVNNLLLTISRIRPGTVYLDKLLQHMNNAKLIVLHSIFQSSKMYNKLYYPNLLSKKDGKLSISLGLTWFKVESEDSNIMMQNMINGFKLILEHHMPSWVFWDKKVELSKLSKLKKKEMWHYKFISTEKPFQLKEKLPLESF